MTKKKKIIIGVIAAWVVLGSLWGIGARNATRNFGEMALPGLNTTPTAVKDFEPVELVFVTTATKGRAGVAEARDLLLKEAQKLGGHAILNVRIDKQKKDGKTIVAGSALAIRYTDGIGVSALNSGIASITQRWQGIRR